MNCVISRIRCPRNRGLTKKPPRLGWLLYSDKPIYQTLISTSTPEGNSNFIKASTVLELEL